MPTFSYRAFTDSGTETRGALEADNEQAAMAAVAAKGLIPSAVRRTGGGLDLAWLKKAAKKSGKVKAADLILFTKQFRTMFRAGLSITKLLEVLEHQTEHQGLKDAIVRITQDIRAGSSLHEAFRRHPAIFSTLYCSMLQAGESSGSLTEVLERMIYIIEHDYKVRKQITSALIYPAIVIVMLLGAFLFLLTFVLPQFVTMFSNAGVELPLPTRINMAIYEFLRGYWPYVIVGLAAGGAGFVAWSKTSRGRFILDTIFLRFPLVGPVLQKGAMSRFASIFAILQSSGVSVLESIRVISGVIGNVVIAREFDRLREKLEEGRGISGPLRSSRWFTPMVINMIAIGEESGNLEEMLREVAIHYDFEVEYAVGRLTELITPILTVGLAGVVGFFVLSIYLPLADLIKAMK
ncbi:MAG: type II secretion system F family protein [Thermodesulfobacteriota bacterium]